MDFTAIIPARAASARLPNKPLLDIAGKPMIIHTLECVMASGAKEVWVATDTPTILETVHAHGYQALLTHTDHPTGTDRLAEAVDKLGLDDDALIVNVQGDEPCLEPTLIEAVAHLLTTQPSAAIATCAAPITNAETLFNPHVVKVVLNHLQHALYFSRAPIPWARDALAANSPPHLAHGLPAWQHMGLYAYRARFLRQFPQLPPGILERHESLEQLRALEQGYTILVHTTSSPPHASVDTPADLARIRALYAHRLKQIAPHHKTI